MSRLQKYADKIIKAGTKIISFIHNKIEKMEKVHKHLILISVLPLIFWELFVIHYQKVSLKYPHYDLSQRTATAFFDVFRKAFAILPLPPGTLDAMIWSTFVWIIAFFLIYVNMYIRRHYNPDTVHGDERWLKNLNDYNKKYTEPFGKKGNSGKNNIILSSELYLSMDNQRTRRNINVFAIGGSGAGKSYNLVGPNVMQANCSYVITDPSGGLYKEYGAYLEYYGYKVKCFNLSNMNQGNKYNPFNYIHSDKDIQILVTTLIENTTPPDKKGGDPFWEKSEAALLVALIAYLYHYADKSCKHFASVMKLMRAADVDENDASKKSALDYIFKEVEDYYPDSFAVKQYKTFKMGAGKTLKGILISCAVRLQAFDLWDVENLTSSDNIELDEIGNQKTALFIILPTGEKTFNFLAAMMYSQMFQRTYDYCENTAEFSQLIVGKDREVLKCFKANNIEESNQVAKDAKDYLERSINGRIIKNEQLDWYELRTELGELVLHRKTWGLAKEALEELKVYGDVIANSRQSNKGQRLPIHTRLILDEFANIGKIPEFESKVATIRKYELSVSIILQSLTQLKKLYKDNWSEITGNCDTTIYLGGGADTETAKWFSELIGKETRIVMSQSFGRGGSLSLNRQGVDLLSPAQLRRLPEDDCIIIPKSLFAYKGKKYKTPEHPKRDIVTSLPPYNFSSEKTEYLVKEMGWQKDERDEEDPENEIEEAHGNPLEKLDETENSKRESEETKAKKEKAKEAENNEDAENAPIVGSAKKVDETENDINEDFSNLLDESARGNEMEYDATQKHNFEE